MISNIREGGAEVGHQRATPSNFSLVPVSFRKFGSPPSSQILQAVCSLSNQQHWDKLRRSAIGASAVNAANVKRETTVKTEPGTAKRGGPRGGGQPRAPREEGRRGGRQRQDSARGKLRCGTERRKWDRREMERGEGEGGGVQAGRECVHE